MNDRLFVYGIFLGEDCRQRMGMENPRYAVLDGWKTAKHPAFGEYSDIVQAVKGDKDDRLTGLVVDVDPKRWNELDKLEGAYTRQEVMTSRGTAYIYGA